MCSSTPFPTCQTIILVFEEEKFLDDRLSTLDCWMYLKLCGCCYPFLACFVLQWLIQIPEIPYNPSYILTIQRGAIWNHFEGQKFFVYGWCFLHALRHSHSVNKGESKDQSLGLGIAKVNAEHWQFGSLAASMACIKLALFTVMPQK